MIPHKYIVTLTNGVTEQKYKVSAFSEREAIILAQADAIHNARGYELVSVKQIDDIWCQSYFVNIDG